MIALVHEMTYRVTTTEPLEPTQGAPAGARQYWKVSAAELVGPRIRASLAGTGVDWMGVGSDGFWRPDVRAQFRTDDGEIVLMHYTGLVEQSPAFQAEADRPTSWDEQYMRLAITFDTGAAAYSWLTTSLFVAAGRLLGTGKIEYDVHRIT
ncbi:MAG TPA: DUF3237 domain-containing protein [Lapillicoccus sp.]